MNMIPTLIASAIYEEDLGLLLYTLFNTILH
jgi:hypothetical protein